MLNMIRADFYRIFRSRSLYITEVILIIFVVLLIFAKQIGTFGVMSATSTGFLDKINSIKNFTGTNSLMLFSFTANVLLYFSLPLVTLSVGHDLAHRTIKNLLTSGINRCQFYLSKYVVFLIISGLQMISYYGIVFIVGTIKNGLGTVEHNIISHFLRVFTVQYLAFQAIFALAFLILYLTFKTAATVTAVILLPSILTVINIALIESYKIHTFKFFDFSANISTTWNNKVSSHFWLYSCLAALVVIVLANLASFNFFNKKNFKQVSKFYLFSQVNITIKSGAT